MAKKKIYKHHERATSASAKTDAQLREIVAGRDTRQIWYSWSDGLFTDLSTRVVTPEDYGAVGDGATDDTAAVQAAIDAATLTTAASPVARGYSKTTVVFNAIYAVTATIQVINKFGFSIRGGGSKRQCGLVWTGATSATAVVMSVSNVYYCSFKNLSLDANNKAGYSMRLDNQNVPGSANSYSIGTHENTWDEVMFLGSTVGACQVGYSGTRPGSVLINNQIDWCYWTNCHFSSAGYLMQVEGSNTFHLYIRGGEANDFGGRAFNLLNGGQVHLDGVGMSCGGTPGAAPVGTYFYRGTNFGTFTVSRCQQEGNALTLEAPDDSGSANHSPILFKGNVFGYTGATELSMTAYKLVDYRQRGYFHSEGDKWGCNPTNTVLAQLYFAPPGSVSLVQLDGLRIVPTETEVVQSGNTVVSGFSKDGILTACAKFMLGTRLGRTIAGIVAQMQLESAGSAARVSVSSATDDEQGSELYLHKARGTALASNTVVQSGDVLGKIGFAGSDGTDAEPVGASITVKVDGTPGSNDMPGRIEVATTPDGSDAPVLRWVIDNLGKLIGYNASAAEKLRIDPINSKVLIGNATSRTISSQNRQVQVEAVSGVAGISIVRNSADEAGPSLVLGKTRSTAASTNTIVQNGDSLGFVGFVGADGADLDASGPGMEAVVEGTPGANEVPTQLKFKTTRPGYNDAEDTLILTAEGLMILPVSKTPANATATGVKGTWCYDTSYIYICTATNTWKRVAIATW